MYLTITILIAICSLVLAFKCFRARTLPPGPICLPIIGNIIDVAWVYFGKISQHELLSQWALRYGTVFRYWLGNQLIVVINDAKLVREAFMTEDMADRPPNAAWFDEATQGTGMIFTSGHIWRDERKFAVGVLRNLGTGNPSFQDVISKEVKELAAEFKAKEERPFSPQELFRKSTCNVISSVIVGQRFSYSDDAFSSVIKATNRNAQIGTGLIYFPFLKHLPGMSKLLDEYDSNLRLSLQFLQEIVLKQQKTYDKDNMRDMVDSFLREIKETDSAGLDPLTFVENNLAVLLLDLFVTGTVTVSTVLSWFLLYMVAKPDLQHKIQQEIDTVVGQDRRPNMADKSSLPFTMAVTLEVMRLQTIIPVLTHYAAKDSYVQGFLIPKGAVVFGNVWHMLHDSDIWEEPYEFKPERFLDKDGHFNPRSDIMIPFGKGRRMCIGEQISKMELFIFVTNLLHEFNFKLADESASVSFDGIDGVNHTPKPYKLVAIPRDANNNK